MNTKKISQKQSDLGLSKKKYIYTIALIGGIDRLKKHYIEEAKRLKINLHVYNSSEVNLKEKIENQDAVVIFTGKISHRVKQEAMGAVKSRNIPVLMSHSCGICSLRDCMNCLLKKKDNKYN